MYHFFVTMFFPFPKLVKWMGRFHDLPHRIQQHMMDIHRKTIQKTAYMRKCELLRDGKLSAKDFDAHVLMFLSKENESWHKLPYVLRMYPDAHWLCFVRDPVDSIKSLGALVQASTLAKTGVQIPSHPPDDSMEILGQFVAQKRIDCIIHVDLHDKKLSPSQSTSLSFELLLRNMLPTYHYVCERLGVQLYSEFADYLLDLQKKQDERPLSHYTVDGPDSMSGKGGPGFGEYFTHMVKKTHEHERILAAIKAKKQAESKGM